jgi:hypothetical protein
MVRITISFIDICEVNVVLVHVCAFVIKRLRRNTHVIKSKLCCVTKDTTISTVIFKAEFNILITLLVTHEFRPVQFVWNFLESVPKILRILYP